jgi:hypothetical protein
LAPPKLSLRARLLPDRHVRCAFAIEWRLIPVRPTVSQKHARELGHEIQLRRIHISKRGLDFPPAVVLDHEMVGNGLLRNQVRISVISHIPLRLREDTRIGTRWQVAQVGDATSIAKNPPGSR